MEENKTNINEIDGQITEDIGVQLPRNKNAKDWVIAAILGFFIGIAVIIPGLSGGTIAILFKLYDKIISAISNLFKSFAICFLFLLPILIGAIIGFILGFFAIQQLIDIALLECTALFTGLMLGSVPSLKNEIKIEKFKVKYVFLIILGIVLPIILSSLSIFLGDHSTSETQITDFPYYLYLLMIPVGMFMGLSQVVPGVSATAFLMAIGYYSKFINTVHLSYWEQYPQIFAIYSILVVFFLLGMFITSKFLNYFLVKYKTETYLLLLGFLFGSLICMFYNSEMFSLYSHLYDGSIPNWQLHVGLAIPIFILGVSLSYLLVKINTKNASTVK